MATWKKVIRVISHELNNSLAPIASLAHSGAELARRGERGTLARRVRDDRRARAPPAGFIDGYARFAKLPAPRPEPVDWAAFVDGAARADRASRVDGALPAEPGCFDPAQLEQALVNLLKNAHESGGPADEVTLRDRAPRATSRASRSATAARA